MSGDKNDMDAVLAELISLSETMLHQAETGEWENLIETGRSRQQLIDAHLFSEDAVENTAAMQEKLQRFLEMNRTLETLCEQLRDQALEGIARLHRGKRGVAVYTQKLDLD